MDMKESIFAPALLSLFVLGQEPKSAIDYGPTDACFEVVIQFMSGVEKCAKDILSDNGNLVKTYIVRPPIDPNDFNGNGTPFSVCELSERDRFRVVFPDLTKSRVQILKNVSKNWLSSEEFVFVVSNLYISSVF